MKKQLTLAVFTIILLSNATSVKAEDWQGEFKNYSQTLYQQGKPKQAQLLGRWFKARQNQRNGSTLNANEIMNLHYRNDLEAEDAKAMQAMNDYAKNSGGRY